MKMVTGHLASLISTSPKGGCWYDFESGTAPSGKFWGTLLLREVGKAQDEYGHPGYPQFTYKEPNGNLVSVTGAKELPKTECLDGSVAVQGMYYPLQMNVGDYFVVAQALAEKMLILSAKLIHKDSTKPDIS